MLTITADQPHIIVMTSSLRCRRDGRRTDVLELRLRSTRHPPAFVAEASQRSRISHLRLLQAEELVVLHREPPQSLGHLNGRQLESQRPLMFVELKE